MNTYNKIQLIIIIAQIIDLIYSINNDINAMPFQSICVVAVCTLSFLSIRSRRKKDLK